MPPKRSEVITLQDDDHHDSPTPPHAGSFSANPPPTHSDSKPKPDASISFSAGPGPSSQSSDHNRSLKRHKSLTEMPQAQTTHTFALHSVSHTARPIRQRIAIACRYCRRRKIKCHGFDPNTEGSKCANCIRFSQECIFTPVSSVAAPVRTIPSHSNMSLQNPMQEHVGVPQRRAASLSSTYYWRQPAPSHPMQAVTHLHGQHQAPHLVPQDISQNYPAIPQPPIYAPPPNPGDLVLPPLAPGPHRIFLPPPGPAPPPMVNMPLAVPLSQHRQTQHQYHQGQPPSHSSSESNSASSTPVPEQQPQGSSSSSKTRRLNIKDLVD